MKKAVCLFSGGLDSATVLYGAQKEEYQITALTAHYGQRHAREIDAARVMAQELDLPHYFVSFSLPWKGSALLDPSIPVGVGRAEDQMKDPIPATYVPARNSIFLSLAASCAEACGADTIFIGANALDYSGYPDCRPEYFEAFEQMILRGTKAGCEGRPIEILAPLLRLSKKNIVELAASLGVPFEKTWSCYQGGKNPCGECDSCILRAKGFREAGIPDPLLPHAVSSVR